MSAPKNCVATKKLLGELQTGFDKMDEPVLGAGLLSRPPVAIGASPYSGGNPLSKYFDSVDAGPGIWKWSHYFDIYHKHLARFRGTNATLVEVIASVPHRVTTLV